MSAQQQFFKALEAAHCFPLWQLGREALTTPGIVPHIWRWREMRQLAIDSLTAEQNIAKGGERRSLLLVNPGSQGAMLRTNNTIISAIQIIKPGESATAHRHSIMALRFILEGSSAYTVVDGEKVFMEQGDLVITPQWAWHDHAHTNASDKPMIWFDALDAPMAQFVDAMFIEPYSQDMQEVTVAEGYTASLLGGGVMRNVRGRITKRTLPMNYKWNASYQALLNAQDHSEFDGAMMEYTNPVDGGHTLPSTACYLQRLGPREATRTHRHTESVIYVAAKGAGTIVLDGKRLDWEFGDVFVVPSWIWHSHENSSSSSDAVLFSMSDKPVLEALALDREEARE